MTKRVPTYPVNELFIKRWSPRAMSGEPITDPELMTLFEAGRWAPSSYNNQPWRFIYAKRDTPEWERLFGLLVEFNQTWCKNAAVLVVIVAHKFFSFNGKPSRTHAFDTGSAWMSIALQGAVMNLVVHGMEGFDYQRAAQELAIPDDYVVLAMCAIGRPGKKEDLPEKMQESEEPSERKPLEELVFEGTFK